MKTLTPEEEHKLFKRVNFGVLEFTDDGKMRLKGLETEVEIDFTHATGPLNDGSRGSAIITATVGTHLGDESMRTTIQVIPDKTGIFQKILETFSDQELKRTKMPKQLKGGHPQGYGEHALEPSMPLSDSRNSGRIGSD